MTILTISSLVLAAIGVACLFIPRLPAVVPAYGAMVCAYCAGATYITGDVLLFWGIAAFLILGLRMLQPVPVHRGDNFRIVLGAIAGTLVGYAVEPVVAAIIVGGAAGACIGTAFCYRTDSTAHKASVPNRFVKMLAAVGLPAVICCSMAAITAASLL